MNIKVRDITAAAHMKRTGDCPACNMRLVWHASNGPKITKTTCPTCGGLLEKPSKEPLPTYSADGVMFDNGRKLEMFTPIGGYGDGPVG